MWKCVLTREVSIFQRLICTQEYTIGTSKTVLIREVSLSQRCPLKRGSTVKLNLLLNLFFLDYLLSNNHINSIIVLKLDFSDEEILAYYISFLKTLSFKLNKHTIHFFYNEVCVCVPWTRFDLKSDMESMVRIESR